MAIGLSVKAQALIEEIGIQPQIILDIEGVELIFGARPILKVLTWDDESDDARWDNNLLWDGSIADINSRNYISLDGTTTNITQQIEPDKGSTSSISTVNITIVDKNGEVSRAFSFDSISEILGRKTIFAIGFADGNYPEDATPIFRGVIVDFYTQAGNVVIGLASPESLKRQIFLEKFQTELTGAINDSQTNIPLQLTAGIYPSQDALTTYIKVEEELMEVTSIGSSSVNVVRSQLETLPIAHDITDVETFYRLQGKPLELALKIMLSKENNEFFSSLDIPKSINFVSVTETLKNSLIFDYYDIEEKTGLTIGDFVKIDSGTYQIIEFGLLDSGSYITLDSTLTTQPNYTGIFEYKSKYNVLPTGLGMLTSEVDVAGFEEIINSFGSSFVDLDIYIKDSIDDAKDFIDKQIFYPSLFSIPRKARSSVKFIAPPFSSDIVPTIDVNSISNITKLKQRRSIHKYLYNTYVFRYNVDSIEDKYRTGKIIVAGDSVDRLNVGKKQLKIESDGLRNNAETTNWIENIGQRLIDRYQYAPVYFQEIELKYKDGYTIEVGDIVPFGGTELKITDLQSGERGSALALYECINKSLNVKNGNIRISLAQTSFEIEARYAVVSLASQIGTGSTVNRIKIVKTNDTLEYARESDKWKEFTGEKVRIVSPDYTFDEESTLLGVDPTDNSFLLLETDLNFAPNQGYFIEIPEYSDVSSTDNNKYKLEFAHFTGQAVITSVTDNKTFDINDITKVKINSQVYVHSNDYSRDSFGGKFIIADITGNTVTLDSDLSFTPQIGDLIEGSRFQDDGKPYLIIWGINGSNG